MPELTLPVSEEEFEKAGSKFISFSPNDPLGKLYAKQIEMDVPDWDTPGVSIKFPVRIIGPEGDPDIGKEDKLSCGVSPDAIWKLKDVLNALGVSLEMREGADEKKHPVFDTDAVAGKQAVGCWELQAGSKGGDPTKGTIKYPKLVTIMPAGQVAKELT